MAMVGNAPERLANTKDSLSKFNNTDLAFFPPVRSQTFPAVRLRNRGASRRGGRYRVEDFRKPGMWVRMYLNCRRK